jgi:hypothetical protein
MAFPSSSSHTTPFRSPPMPILTQASSLSLVSVLVPPPSTQARSPRDLQRQQEVRDRLSGKPGPKESSLIEMYREKERQASGGSGNLPGKSSSATSIVTQQQPQQRLTSMENESTPLPPLHAPPSSEPSLSPVDTPVMGQGGEL